MRKFYTSFLVFLFLFSFSEGFTQSANFRVEGTKIIHPDGHEFIPFGGNMNGYKWGWTNRTRDHINSFVNDWKFNTVRLNCYIKGYHRSSQYWQYGDFKGTYNVNNDLDLLIELFTSRGVVVQIEAHDWTGQGINVTEEKFFNNNGKETGNNDGETLENPFTEYGGRQSYDSQFDILVDFFTYFAEKYKDNPYVWFNPMNEPGTVVDNYYQNGKKYGQVPQYYADMHIQFIQAMRRLGFNNVIVVDGLAAGQDHGQWWGHNPSTIMPHTSGILSKGREILNADSLGNTVFSFHAYHNWGRTANANLISEFIDAIHAKGLAVHIGEAGWYADKESAEPGVAYHRIFDQDLYKGKGVGVLAWHLQPGDGMALVREGTFSRINNTTNPTNLTWMGKRFWELRNKIYGIEVEGPSTNMNDINAQFKIWSDKDFFYYSNIAAGQISISDVSGRIHYEGIVSDDHGKISVSHLPAGVYIVNLWHDGASFTGKIIK
jgi:mannan endo-1,4-beta-mannosidase